MPSAKGPRHTDIITENSEDIRSILSDIPLLLKELRLFFPSIAI